MKKEQRAAQRITGNDYVSYLRVSSRGQVNTDYNPEGVSIPAQREKVDERGRELGSAKAEEFVDPGRSGRTIDQRPEFQQMIQYLREHPNVRYVIVYMLSRFARNRLDDAIMVATLEKLGVRLISAVEKNIDDTPTGRMLHGMLAVINEYASTQSAEDVKYKMGQKAKNGGTITRAPVGYLNVIEHIEDRRVRTVAIDPVRGPLIRLAFELYATGEFTLADLVDELYERGLRMARTARYPERGISANRLAVVLRDDYYCGWITYDDQKIPGRHEALVSRELFDRVQDIANSRTQSQELRRVHHHELKGSLFCGSCLRRHGERRRMIIQNAVNRQKRTYRYFFCTGRYDHSCELPFVQIERIEEAVEAHYATVGFTPEFITELRSELTRFVDEQNHAAKLLHTQLTKQLAVLDTKETNLIDLAADGKLPTAKIRAKLHEIALERERLTARLNTTDQDLKATAELIETCLQLLDDPQALYQRCDEHQRRRLNQALFYALYVDDEGSDGIQIAHHLNEPFAALHAARAAVATPPAAPAPEAPVPSGQAASGYTAAPKSALPLTGKGAMGYPVLTALLGSTEEGSRSNCRTLVGDTGIEPVTPAV